MQKSSNLDQNKSKQFDNRTPRERIDTAKSKSQKLRYAYVELYFTDSEGCKSPEEFYDKKVDELIESVMNQVDCAYGREGIIFSNIEAPKKENFQIAENNLLKSIQDQSK